MVAANQVTTRHQGGVAYLGEVQPEDCRWTIDLDESVGGQWRDVIEPRSFWRIQVLSAWRSLVADEEEHRTDEDRGYSVAHLLSQEITLLSIGREWGKVVVIAGYFVSLHD